MNRFFYYLVILNMIANVVAYVPSIMIDKRFSGTVMAIPIAAILGFLFLYIFTKAMSKFPKKGLPEILKDHTPRSFRIIYLFVHGILWFQAGLITLLAFTSIIKLFLSPDMPDLMITMMFLLFLCLAILLPSNKILYALEIILILNLPFILFIMIKSIFNHYFNWDSVKVIITHYRELPSWMVISSAFFIFVGYTNLIIFNRCFHKLETKWLWPIFFLGIGVMTTTFLIPIGFHGADGVSDYVYPWVSTADSMRMELGFIERVLFVFILLYICISIMSIDIHWHVGLELLKSVLPPMKWKGKARSSTVITLFFAIITLLVTRYTDENINLLLAKFWLGGIIPILGFMTIILLWIARRVKNEK